MTTAVHVQMAGKGSTVRTISMTVILTAAYMEELALLVSNLTYIYCPLS